MGSGSDGTSFTGTVFTDSFNRPDGDLTSTSRWALVAGGAGGNLVVSSGKLAALATDTTGTAAQGPDLGSANHYVQASIQQGAGISGPFICARLVDANNFVGIRYNTNSSPASIELYKRVAGTLTSLVAASSANRPIGAVMRLEVSGDMATVKSDGAVILGPVVIGGSNTTGNRAGVVARVIAANPWIDNFEVGVLA
jgi:hypothetical protein